MTLAETQELFHGLVSGELPLDEVAVERTFLGTDELPAVDRVAIYRDMYVSRLTEALRETFPNVARFLGEERFARLAESYVWKHPSEHHDVGRIGRSLAGFLREYPDPDRPDLADLADLEWTRNEVFFAPDSPVVGPDALTAAGPENAAGARLCLSVAVRVIELASDAAALWKRMESGEAPDPPAPGRFAVVVWRRGFDVFHCAVPMEEAMALRAAMAGEALDSICAAFADRPDPAADAHAALSSWFNEGWIATVRPMSSSRLQAGQEHFEQSERFLRAPAPEWKTLFVLAIRTGKAERNVDYAIVWNSPWQLEREKRFGPRRPSR